MQQTSSSISINSNSNDSHKHKTTNQKLTHLKSQITLPQEQIHNLLNHKQPTKFIDKIIELNTIAGQRIQQQHFDQGLAYLLQAQRLLEKSIERERQVQKKIVICTLHNIACCYQKNWELEKCSNYLEALIFNLNSILNNVMSEGNNGGSGIIVRDSNRLSISVMKNGLQSNVGQSKAVNTKIGNLMLNIQARYMLGRYYLQFCAVNSQINNHSGALISARKSIQAMKKMFQQLLYFIKNFNSRSAFMGNKQKQRQQRQQFQQKTRLIYQVSKLADNINISQYDMILQTTRYYLRLWQSIQERQSLFSRLNAQLQDKFRNFSIGSIAQIDALKYEEFFVTTEDQKARLLSTQSIMEKVLVMIIGYFTISTELRLMTGNQNPISQLSENINSSVENNHKNEQQKRQAEIYHLFSIILTAVFIPFDILYMKHILLSYRNHYANDLFLPENVKENQHKVYQEFLFTISQIKKGSMLGLECEESIFRDERKTNDFFGQGKKYSYIKGSIIEKQHQNGISNNKKPLKNKDGKTKSKSKSKSKKSTLKTISALSAQSKTKEKLDPLNSKSPQIHTQPSLSKGKNKKSSLKSNTNKITSLQYIFQQTKKKQKSKQAMKKHEYAGIKPTDMKKRNKNINTIEQTNAYFLKKTTPSSKVIKPQSKSKSKDSKIKSPGLKGLTANNPTQLYYHKQQIISKGSSKSRSKQKSLRKGSQLTPKITITPANATNTQPPVIQNSKKSLYQHYS